MNSPPLTPTRKVIKTAYPHPSLGIPPSLTKLHTPTPLYPRAVAHMSNPTWMM